MHNQEKPIEEKPATLKNAKQKTKQKKTGKIKEVSAMHTKGASVKDISEKMKISERIVRSYVWRAKNPEKFKALLARYQEKRKKKLAEKTNQIATNTNEEQNSQKKA